MADESHYKLKKIPRWRLVVFPVFAPILALAMRAYWRSCRVVSVTGSEHLDELARAGEPMIPCYWHQRQLFCAYYLFRRRRKDFQLAALVSPSRDGELGARILQQLGARPIRGSDRRTGAQAMRDLFLAMKKDGLSPVMTPDGSKGPVHEFKPGAVMLAQLSKAPMVPISFAARRAFRLKTWDRFLIPWPFTRIAIAVGAPCRVEPGSKLGDSADMQERMKNALNEVEAAAEAAVGNTGKA